jgi:WD40 repeat protein
MAAAVASSASLTLPRPVTCLAALPNTPMVAAGLANGRLVLWNGRDKTPTATMTPHKARVLAVGATANGRDVLSVAADGTLVRSRRDTRAAGGATRVDFGGAPPRAAVFSADGARLMTGGEFGDIRVFDAASGALKHALRGHLGEMMDLAARPNSDVLASAGADADIRLWDVAAGTQTGFIDTDLSTFALAFSPKDGTLASGGTDRRLTLRDPKTMTVNGMFELRAPKMVATLAWSPDGRLIAVGDVDDETLRKGGLELVDAASRESVATLDTGNVPARFIAFLSDGGLVGSVNRDLRAWNLAAVK